MMDCGAVFRRTPTAWKPNRTLGADDMGELSTRPRYRNALRVQRRTSSTRRLRARPSSLALLARGLRQPPALGPQSGAFDATLDHGLGALPRQRQVEVCAA